MELQLQTQVLPEQQLPQINLHNQTQMNERTNAAQHRFITLFKPWCESIPTFLLCITSQKLTINVCTRIFQPHQIYLRDDTVWPVSFLIETHLNLYQTKMYCRKLSVGQSISAAPLQLKQYFDTQFAFNKYCTSWDLINWLIVQP